MSTDNRIEKRKALTEVAKQIDGIASGAMQVFDAGGDFAQELTVATAVVDMRQLLIQNPDIMAPVMALMNTDLGFRTDRDPKVRGKNGEYPQPYAVEVVRDVFIEARMRGFHLVGNEFNIIAGRFYGCKNGLERKVKELTQGTCEISIDVPQMQPGFAKVKCRATWKCKGQSGDIGIRQDDPCEFLVRVNEFMGPDGAMGKAERKLYARIFKRLTGKDIREGEAGENAVDVAATVQPVDGAKAQRHEFEPAETQAGAGAIDVKVETVASNTTSAAKPERTLFLAAEAIPVDQRTPQQHLEVYMTECDVPFEKFRAWAAETDRLADPTSYGSWSELPTDFCEALKKDSRSLSRCVIRCKS